MRPAFLIGAAAFSSLQPRSHSGDLFDGYRAMCLLMACYTALAFVAVLFVPRGVDETDTGPDAVTGLN
jgi:hypothetical protein